MANNRINSMGDLRSEIIRLRTETAVREGELKEEFQQISEKIQAPFRLMQELGAWFGIGGKADEKSSDWLTSVAQLGVPYLLNSLIFKRSGFILKALIALVSQKAVAGINMDKMTGWIEKISQWIQKQSKQKQAAVTEDRADNGC